MKKKTTSGKLSLEKFQIAKLSDLSLIKGGSILTDTTTTNTTGTTKTITASDPTPQGTGNGHQSYATDGGN
ncbi:class I lanthipeptide [Aquimarina sp. MMG016]|uniref:class I lanthipeptide n=1 Tax=Aquimarina sp. MMG016 TaxID=2822690 RepID=UPI001B3A005B|nr:class I lanthipeptide [Aquimarina sp. MMG016]MBQ4821832.1 class I lanthipeptide [Aquimarina sp. MMG016]